VLGTERIFYHHFRRRKKNHLVPQKVVEMERAWKGKILCREMVENRSHEGQLKRALGEKKKKRK